MNCTQSHSLNQPKSQNFWLCTMPITLLGYLFFFFSLTGSHGPQADLELST